MVYLEKSPEKEFFQKSKAREEQVAAPTKDKQEKKPAPSGNRFQMFGQ